MAAAAVAAAGSSNVEFIRARSDKREYRRVVLANALEILLISDPDTDKVRPLLRPLFACSAPLPRSAAIARNARGLALSIIWFPGLIWLLISLSLSLCFS
jgi:hypothetical protein